jgi:hypothetical protein
MSMTKKDYVAIADVMNEVMWTKGADPATTTTTVLRLGKLFASENINFKYETFMSACFKDREVGNV